jgi:SAM-dependent methyltransferase
MEYIKHNKNLKNIDILNHSIKFYEYDYKMLSKVPDYPEKRDIPYWLEVHSGAIVLANHLANFQEIDNTKSVVEIGCGSSFVSLVCKYLGADVTPTDYSSEAIEITLENWQLNFSEICKAAVMDWSVPNEQYKSDILVCSDIVYGDSNFETSLNSFNSLSNSLIFMCEDYGKDITFVKDTFPNFEVFRYKGKWKFQQYDKVVYKIYK